VVSTGVRLFAWLAALSCCVAACAGSASVAPTTATPGGPTQVNPARIERVRTELPSGYEVVPLSGRAAPVAFWGLGLQWTADPPQCGALGDPVANATTTRGWSASGTGGIVYAVVAASKATLDPSLTDECAQWTVSAGHTSGTVTGVEAPTVYGAVTCALSTTTTTAVEGGTETHSHANTFTAYLDGYVAFVTVVTDPGSPNPSLGQDFAAELLVKTVSALRG
jgi:uncharacterized protein DUF5642